MSILLLQMAGHSEYELLLLSMDGQITADNFLKQNEFITAIGDIHETIMRTWVTSQTKQRITQSHGESKVFQSKTNNAGIDIFIYLGCSPGEPGLKLL